MSGNWEEEEVIAKVSFVEDCELLLPWARPTPCSAPYVHLMYIRHLTLKSGVLTGYISFAGRILLSCGF